MEDYDILLISCIDKRFVNTITNIIDNMGLAGRVYRMEVAGASLISSDAPEYFDKHIRLLSSTLRKVIVIDHEDCVAYKACCGGNQQSLASRFRSINQESLISQARMLNEKSLTSRIKALNKELGINIDVNVYMVNTKGELLEYKY